MKKITFLTALLIGGLVATSTPAFAQTAAPPAPATPATWTPNFAPGTAGILWGPLLATQAQFGLRIFNPDASEAEKSGNGLRIFSRYLYDQKLAGDKPFTIAGETVTSKTIDITETKTFEVATKEALNLTITGADESSKVLVLNAPAEPAEEAPEEPAGEPEAEAPALGKGTVEGTVWFQGDGGGIPQGGGLPNPGFLGGGLRVGGRRRPEGAGFPQRRPSWRLRRRRRSGRQLRHADDLPLSRLEL